MKFFAVAAAAIAALTAPVAVAEECDLGSLIITLLPLYSSTNYATCSSDSGYSLIPFTGPPTATQLTAICASTACKELLADAVALNLPDCTIAYNGVDYNVKTELTAYATACGAV